MADMDMGLSSQQNNNGNKKKRKKKKKQNLFMSIVTGLIPWKGDSVTEVFRKIVFLASLVILVVALVLIMNHFLVALDDPNQITTSGTGENGEQNHAYIVDLKNQAPTQAQIDQMPEGTINEEYATLYDTNNDFIGWLNIPGTNVDYPIMQSDPSEEFVPCKSYTDYGYCDQCSSIIANDGEGAHEFYLHHSFDNYYSFAGTIFADYEGEFGIDTMPNNTILYGHNMRYEHQFTALNNYRTDIGFLRLSPVINFDTLYQKNQYKIFAVFLTNTREDQGEVFDYFNHVSFNSSAEFYDYVLECMDRSMYETGVDIEYGDEFLTLSTCDASVGLDDMRLVIVARKVRENESPTVDPDNIVRKTSMKFCEAYIRAYGDKWDGRTWDISLVKGMAEYIKENGLEDPAE